MNTGSSVIPEALTSRGSSLDHVLRTNNAPSDKEADEIRSLLQDIEEHLKVQNRSESHPAMLSDFQPDKMEQLKDLSMACRSALSTLRRIPPEIVSCIFSQTSPDPPLDFINEHWDSLDVMKEPWTLTQVSRAWRAIALAHREIWSHVRINLEALHIEGSSPPALAGLLCCLQRSGDHALSIFFKDSYTPTIEAKELLLALLPQSPRWKNVKFSLFFPHLPLLAEARGRLPLLHSLDIHAYGANTVGVPDAFEVAPRLREVSLSIGDPRTIRLPWSQITRLEGWVVPSMSVLLDASQVVDCSLSFSSWYAKDPSVSVVRSHTLRRLQTNLKRSLDELEAPFLEDLHIGSLQQVWGEPPAQGHITSFLRRSSCSLRSLLLSGVTIEGESDLIPLLESTPSLVFLQVKYGIVNWNALVRVLTITDTRCLVPNLKSIRFNFGRGKMLHFRPDGEFLELVDMIESRFHVVGREGVGRLESIALFELPQPSSAQWVRLGVLKELGLRVVDDMEPEVDFPPVVRWADTYDSVATG